MAPVLTLYQVAARPDLLERQVQSPTGHEYGLKPLTAADQAALCVFLTQLSDRTRRFYSLGRGPAATAGEWCEAIARYDKLRLVVTDGSQVVGVVEFSFDLPPGDLERFESYRYELDPRSDCRIGVCLADALQGQGVGSALLPHCRDIARRFGRTRMILWGGVMIDNTRAVAYYRRSGFQAIGEFLTGDGTLSLDMVLEI